MAENAQTKDSEKPRMPLATRVYKGINMFDNEIEKIEKMDIQDDDVWICTYPRSGTTMTCELVYLIQTLDFATAKSVQLELRVPVLETKDDRFPYYKGLQHLKDLPFPRMIKSHLPSFLLPEQLQNGKGKIIYIYRNPKDVATSYFRLLQWWDQIGEDPNSFNEFVDNFVNGKVLFNSWSKHVLGYWDKRCDRNVLLLTYEEVVRDMPSAIRKIAEFLGRSLTNEDVTKIADHCHVDNMRNNRMVNLAYWRDIRHVNDDAEGRFINKGVAGAWHDVLTPEQSQKIDRLIQELDGSGLNIEQT
ncbi:sulfotransferase 1A1-like [Mercenaria mercenaria]|uniref:sulfotransferase 1A1-like n=1 Tax=Mercenaria mercenaria TaxID=6596 RepID=UPI00234F2DC0|nr:sulfotransferase 1A1-like [Mercenaria mercenaria]